MQLKQPRRHQQYRQDIGRARTLIRQVLGFFPGTIEALAVADQRDLDCPATANSLTNGLRWLSVPHDTKHVRRCTIDEHVLRPAHHAILQLSTTFRPHLEQIVPQADRWLIRIRFAINELTKLAQLSHDQQPGYTVRTADNLVQFMERLPLSNRWKDLAVRIVNQHSGLVELVTAMTWLELTKTTIEDLRPLLWVAQQAAPLSEVAAKGRNSLTKLLKLVWLSQDTDVRWLRFLVQILAHPRIAQTPAKDCTRQVFELKAAVRAALGNAKQVKIPEGKTMDCEAHVDSLLTWLIDLPTSQRSIFSRLMSQLVSENLCAIDDQLLMDLANEQQRLRRQLTKIQYLGLKRYQDECGSQSQQPDCSETLPQGQFLIGMVLQLADRLKPYIANSKQYRILEQFSRSIGQLPIDFRIGLLMHWFGRINYEFEFNCLCQRLGMLTKLFARAGVHHNLIEHWRDCLASQVRDWLGDCTRHYLQPASFQRAVHVVEQLLYVENLRLSNASLDLLIKLCDISSDLRWNTAFMRHRSSEVGTWPTDDSLLHLVRMLDPKCLRPRQIANLIDDNSQLKNCLEEIYKSSPPDWLTEAIQFQIYAGNLQNVYKISRVCMLINCIQTLDAKLQNCEHVRASNNSDYTAADTNRRSVSQRWKELRHESLHTTTWVDQYPDTLRADLIALNSTMGESSQKWAEHALGKDCPSRTKIHAELISLEKMIHSDALDPQRRLGLEHRIRKLRARLVTAQEIDPRRLKNLRAKIQNRFMLATAENFEQTCTQWLTQRLTEYGMRQISPELIIYPYSQILPALLQLEEPHRSLGLKVLGQGMVNPSQFLEEPANKRFLDRMKRRGINIDAWLNSQLYIQRQRKTGGCFRVGFAKKSLDIFLMGFHFQTCLSPDQFNFYSTIGNVADVNKRVLYGTTDDGTIVGRCLVCLNAQGQIQSFHRYEHNTEDGFAAAVDEFLEHLATLMGTVVTDRGTIPRLVVRDWYDDGCLPVKDASRLTFENELKPILEQAPITEVMQRCESVLGSRRKVIQFLSETVDFIYYHRRNLAAACLEWLTASERLEYCDYSLVLAALAKEVGESTLDQYATNCPPVAIIRKRLSRKRLGELLEMPPVVNLLISRDVVLARRLIIETRPANIRCDTDEQHPTRYRALITIHRRLYRHRQAKQLECNSRG